MAIRRLIRRRVRRARPVVRRRPSASALTARKEAKCDMSADSGLMIGGAKDPAERSADQMASRVLRMPAAGADLVPPCQDCEGRDQSIRRAAEDKESEDMVQAKFVPGAGPLAGGTTSAPAPNATLRSIRTMGAGRPLARAKQRFFERRFKADLSAVRIHDGSAAHHAAKSIQARAFTLGQDIAFAKGEPSPETHQGRRLLAHELAHVVSGHKALRRKGDVCLKGDTSVHRSQFTMEVMAASKLWDDNRAVRAIKKVQRCDPTADDAYVSGVMAKSYGAKKTNKLLADSKTALGGHVGFYPGYAGDIKDRLKEVGVTDTEAHKTFKTSRSGKVHKKRAAAKAKGALAKLERADIVYFRGHQFAQYRAPGMFTDGKEERGVDLRYLKRAGGFPNVKLMVSTSCATLCNEAISIFTSLFPKTAIFGYGKSAPLEGKQVRREFGKQVRALKSPLLLESSSDISKLASAWKATIQKRHRNVRDTKKRRPGYFLGKLFYWTGKAWVDGKKGQSENKCRRKRDFRRQYPAPP